MTAAQKPTIPEYLVCPVCKGPLTALHAERFELACPSCGIAFEVRDNIPSMIRNLARTLSDEEKARLKNAGKAPLGESVR